MVLSYVLGDSVLITRILKNIIIGVLHGVLLYLVFVIILPFMLTRVANIPLTTIDQLTMAYILGFFIALGVISSSIKPCVGIVFDIIASLIGLYFLLSIFHAGEFETSIEIAGYMVEASFNLELLLLLIIGFSVAFTILNMFDKIIKSEE